MDLVRRYFRALNARDLAGLADCYQSGCVTEQVFLDEAPGSRCQGLEANRVKHAEFLGRYRGSLEGGDLYRIRTIGGLETGWGWVHAEWVAGFEPVSGGDPRWFVGYSHFLVEEGRIRRHRSVATAASIDELRADGERAERSRTYPTRPVVGVGAVIFVDDRVVLIRRRYEPLAGQWSLPGGTLELGETLEAGVAREVLEETGLVVEVGPVVEVFDRILLDEHRKVRFHFVLIDYLCRPQGGQLAHGSDVSEVTLADPARLEPYELTQKAVGVITRAATMRGGHQSP